MPSCASLGAGDDTTGKSVRPRASATGVRMRRSTEELEGRCGEDSVASLWGEDGVGADLALRSPPDAGRAINPDLPCCFSISLASFALRACKASKLQVQRQRHVTGAPMTLTCSKASACRSFAIPKLATKPRAT
jgi:hypothetical protein